MTNPDSGEQSESPAELSAEARAVITRARRSFGFSIGLLLIGFIAIAFALVYRATRDGGPSEFSFDQVAIPAGAAVVSVVPGDGMLAVTYAIGGDTHIRLFDAKTGAVVGNIAVVSE